jgi:hypothetical protein
VLPGGHLLYRDAAEEVVRELQAFLDEVDGGAR